LLYTNAFRLPNISLYSDLLIPAYYTKSVCGETIKKKKSKSFDKIIDGYTHNVYCISVQYIYEWVDFNQLKSYNIIINYITVLSFYKE